MPPESNKGSLNSLMEANRDRSRRSRHGGLGAAGYISQSDSDQTHSFLSQPGEIAVIDPPEAGFPDFVIGVAWDNVVVEQETGFFQRILKKNIQKAGVDLDLGCLYELKNGLRGGMQAFGSEHGALREEPYIALSRDERRGDKEGQDECLIVNGARWAEIERILIYIYIYGGVDDWASVRPQIQVRVPGQPPMIVTLNTRHSEMEVCAIADLENIRGGLKLTSHLEYFPGHAEMDRAFGFGLSWESGRKDPE